MSYSISPSPRVRRSPFFDSTVAAGVRSFTAYNHMLMPTGYGDAAAEYDRLINGVAMWDVAVERQVELRGPDAARLAQILTPRKLEGLREGAGWYVALCNHQGILINDPILLKLAQDRYWLSIADSDVKLWAQCVAAERSLQVDVFEPDVSPMAIQGPFANDVVRKLLGEEAVALRHFGFRQMMLDDIPLLVARSGWSRQGGFELYLMDGSKGNQLWDRVATAGKEFGIGPGNPNPSERVESGLLSWGGDTDDDTNPFEVRLERYIDLDAPDDVIGIQALRKVAAEGPKRHQLGVVLDRKEPFGLYDSKGVVRVNDEIKGHMTAYAWSPRLSANIGLALVCRSAQSGMEVDVELPDGDTSRGQLCELPFL